MSTKSHSPTSRMERIAMILSVCGTSFLTTFQTGCMTVALPTVQESLNISAANLQWPISAYSLTYGCFLLLSGRLADIFGRKLLFQVGTLWSGVMCLAVSFAPNATTLIILMALLGFGPAANTPAGIGLLSAEFEGRTRDKAFAALGAGQPLGAIFGLITGGILCQTSGSWRSLFWVQSGLSFLFAALGWYGLPKSDLTPDDSIAKRVARIDWTGALLSTTSLLLFAFSLADSQSTQRGWRTPYIPSLFAVSVLLMTAFVAWERHREQSGRSTMLPMSIFKAPYFGTLLLVVLAAWWSFNTVLYFATLYFQSVLLLGPLQTSLRFIPLAIAGTTFNVVAGFLMSRAKPLYLILFGLMFSLGGAALFALIDIHSSYWTMAFFVLILIPGPDLAYSVCNVHICAAVDKQSQALAGGLFAATTRIATAIGLAVTSSVSTGLSQKYQSTHPLLSASSPSVLMAGYRAAGWVCFAAAAIAILTAGIGLRGMDIVNPVETVENIEMEASAPETRTDKVRSEVE